MDTNRPHSVTPSDSLAPALPPCNRYVIDKQYDLPDNFGGPLVESQLLG